MTTHLPLQPVLDHLGLKPGPRNHHDVAGWADTLAEIAGVHVDSVHRWRRKGIEIETADRLACRLDTHLLLLWPSTYPELEAS